MTQANIRMNTWTDDFGLLDAVWLNSAQQGPLPRVAAEAAHEALSWKIAPHRYPADCDQRVPQRLKHALARLVNVAARDIILGNCASYGLHQLAGGIRWRPGDEVLLVDGDFPATVYPWLPLRRCDVNVRIVRPRGAVFDATDLADNLTPATRVLCTNWVNSFTGYAVDVEMLGDLCRSHDIVFVLNASQAIGTRPIDLAEAPVDALVSCGQKWLCGPYGTGFCWIDPAVRENLVPTQAYWSAMQRAGQSTSMRDYTLHDNIGAPAFDVFATANYLNFLPWAASVEYLLDQGIDRIAEHNHALVSRLTEGLDAEKYDVLSPRHGPERSTLAVVSHRDAGRNDELRDALARDGVYVAVREGHLRVSPHLYNTEDDIDRAVTILNAA